MNFPLITSTIGVCLLGAVAFYFVTNLTQEAPPVTTLLPHAANEQYRSDLPQETEPTLNADADVRPSVAAIQLPTSLQNTDPSALIHTDANNNLLLNRDVKMLFDYFFTSQGDITQVDLIARMKRYIRQAYPTPASQQALALLDKYLLYKQHMHSFYESNETLQSLPDITAASDPDMLQAVEELMQSRRAIQHNIFSTYEVDAMFGDTQRYDQFMLEVARLDSNLSHSERQEQLQQLSYSHLSDDEYNAREQTFILINKKPEFQINESGECEGNHELFSAKQVTALCALATQRTQRAEKQRQLLAYKNELLATQAMSSQELATALDEYAQTL